MVQANRVRQIVIGSGTGDLTLGPVAEGHRGVLEGIGADVNFDAGIEQLPHWEVGTYQATAGGLLQRVALEASSNGGQPVDWPAGDKTLLHGATAAMLLDRRRNLADVPDKALARANLGVVSTSRTLSAGTGLSGGGDLSINRTISADVASEAEAVAGTSNSKLITPLRLQQVINGLSMPSFSHDALWIPGLAFVGTGPSMSGTRTRLSVFGNYDSSGRLGNAVILPSGHYGMTDFVLPPTLAPGTGVINLQWHVAVNGGGVNFTSYVEAYSNQSLSWSYQAWAQNNLSSTGFKVAVINQTLYAKTYTGVATSFSSGLRHILYTLPVTSGGANDVLIVGVNVHFGV